MSLVLEKLHGQPHSERLVTIETQQTTPVDELTGLPYPIFFTPEDLDDIQNYHHSWHPENSSALKGISGLALRMSRGQLAPKEIHAFRYHHYYNGYNGPDLKDNIDWKFQKIALGLTDVLPRRALDMRTPNRYIEVEISDDEHHFLSHPSRLHRENRFADAEEDTGAGVIKKFLGFYAIHSFRVGDITEKDLDRLIETESTRTILRLGTAALVETLTNQALKVDKIYMQATEAGMVTHFRTTPSKEIMNLMPAGEMAVYSFTLQEHLREMNRSGEIDTALQTGVDKVESIAA